MNLRLTFFERYKAFAPLFIRLIVGFHLIYGTQDNIFSWQRMLEFEAFLDANGFPLPLISAHISVYAQFIAGILYILGAFTRSAACVMIVNFIVAIVGVHIGDAYPNVFPALMMLAASIFLLLHGPGVPSVDENLIRK